MKTRRQALIDEDWSDLTLGQIAEVFDTDRKQIMRDIVEIWDRYGVEVKFLSTENKKMTVKQLLEVGDFSAMTAAEIAEEIGTSTSYVQKNIRAIERETGEKYPYVRLHPRVNLMEKAAKAREKK